MPRKENRYANRSQINGIQVAVPLGSGQSASQIAKDLDRLISERDDIDREAVNWPKSVQAIAKAQGIPLE
jgi:phage tail sheath gpL-like